jgi:putative transcriptional regulator
MTVVTAFRRQNRLFGFVASVAIAAIAAIVLTLLVVAMRWDAMAAQTLKRLALTWSIFRSGKVRGVRFGAIAKLCIVLECQPGDLLRYEPDPEDLQESVNGEE